MIADDFAFLFGNSDQKNRNQMALENYFKNSAAIGGFHLVAKIIRKLKSHMIPYKFKLSHWLKSQHSD